jgi:hypothetical protein
VRAALRRALDHRPCPPAAGPAAGGDGRFARVKS